MSETGVTFNVTALNQLSVLQTINSSLNAKMIDLGSKMQSMTDKIQELGNKLSSDLKLGFSTIKEVTKEVSIVLQKGFAILGASDVKQGRMSKAQEKMAGGSLLSEDPGDETGISKRVTEVTKGILKMLEPTKSITESLSKSIKPVENKDIFGLSGIGSLFPSTKDLSPGDVAFQKPKTGPGLIERGATKAWDIVNPFTKMGKIMGTVGKAAKEIGNQFQGMIKAQLFMQPLMGALGALLEPFAPLTDIITSMGEILGTAFMPIIQALVPALTSLLPGFMTIAETLKGPIQQAVSYLTPILEKFWGVLEQVWAILEPVLAELWVAMQPVFDMIGQLINDGFEWLGEILLEIAPILVQLVNIFIELLPVIQPIIEAVIRIMGLIGGAFIEIIVKIIGLITSLFSEGGALAGVLEKILTGIQKFIEGLENLLGWLGKGFSGGDESKTWLGGSKEKVTWYNWAGW
jgi:hypothetical protein